MARFENSISPFGVEEGSSTSSAVHCDFCNKTHGEQDRSDETIGFFRFGPLQIASCCFEALEKAVLANMADIVPWYARLLHAREEQLRRDKGALMDAFDILTPE